MPSIKNIIYTILWIALGVILGVFFSQYEYFKISTEISLSDLAIFVLTSGFGLYIASNIQKGLSRIQSIKALYQEDVKAIILYLSKLEEWINIGNIPLNELTAHMKTVNIKMRSMEKLYGKKNSGINISTLPDIITNFNNLKAAITILPVIQSAIMLDPTQKALFSQQAEDIRFELLNAIIVS